MLASFKYTIPVRHSRTSAMSVEPHFARMVVHAGFENVCTSSSGRWTLVRGFSYTARTMGLFDKHCAESGIPLRGNTVLLPVARSGDAWIPAALPVFGTNNRYGSLDELALDEATRRLFEVATFSGDKPRGRWSRLFRKPKPDDVSENISRLVDAPAVWNGTELSYTLIDAGVFDAAARTAATKVPRLSPGMGGLVDRAFPLAFSREMYRNLSYESRKDLIELICFLAYGPVLKPIHELETGQYLDIELGRDRPDDPETPLKWLLEAWIRYADVLLMRQAVLEAAVEWGVPEHELSAVFVVADVLFGERWESGDLDADHGRLDELLLDDPLPRPAIDRSESLRVNGLRFARTALGAYVIEVPTQKRDAVRERFFAQLSLGRDVTLAGETSRSHSAAATPPRSAATRSMT